MPFTVGKFFHFLQVFKCHNFFNQWWTEYIAAQARSLIMGQHGLPEQKITPIFETKFWLYREILWKNGIKCSKTLEMLKVAYGECTVSQNRVYKWYKLFTENREEMNDDARPGRPSTSSTVKCQGFAHCFLWLSWRSASGVLTARSNG